MKIGLSCGQESISVQSSFNVRCGIIVSVQASAIYCVVRD